MVRSILEAEHPYRIDESLYRDLYLRVYFTEEDVMPIRDPVKREIAMRKRLYLKICRECGVRNSPNAEKCRNCRSYNLRWKHREPAVKR